LTNSQQFQRLNARWRIFQRITSVAGLEERPEPRADSVEPVANNISPASQELYGLRQQHRYLLETLRIGIFALGPDETIVQHNTAAFTLCGLPPASLIGKRLADTDLFMRVPDLGSQLQSTRGNN
jgi:PAS domain-containing protein